MNRVIMIELDEGEKCSIDCCLPFSLSGDRCPESPLYRKSLSLQTSTKLRKISIAIFSTQSEKENDKRTPLVK
jgi:hypothetical protein